MGSLKKKQWNRVGRFAPRVAPKRTNRKFHILIAKPRKTKQTSRFIRNLWENQVSDLVHPSTLKVVISLQLPHVVSHETIRSLSCISKFLAACIGPQCSLGRFEGHVGEFDGEAWGTCLGGFWGHFGYKCLSRPVNNSSNNDQLL